MQTGLIKTDYRPEIDGLRALAVIPVIFFHAGFDAFRGGFVGVDIFFVISGYLITTIILRERTRGQFSLLGFYERRARRILPALFLCNLDIRKNRHHDQSSLQIQDFLGPLLLYSPPEFSEHCRLFFHAFLR